MICNLQHAVRFYVMVMQSNQRALVTKFMFCQKHICAGLLMNKIQAWCMFFIK